MIHLHSGLLEMGMNVKGHREFARHLSTKDVERELLHLFKNIYIFSNEIVRIQDKTQTLQAKSHQGLYPKCQKKKKKQH